MSSRYEVAVERTLNRWVSPALTLMSVAKPCSAVLPEPDTSQVLAGVPGLLFSQTTGLTTGAQGSAAAAGPAVTGTERPAATSARAKVDRHRRTRNVGMGEPPPRRRASRTADFPGASRRRGRRGRWVAA